MRKEEEELIRQGIATEYKREATEHQQHTEARKSERLAFLTKNCLTLLIAFPFGLLGHASCPRGDASAALDS